MSIQVTSNLVNIHRWLDNTLLGWPMKHIGWKMVEGLLLYCTLVDNYTRIETGSGSLTLV